MGDLHVLLVGETWLTVARHYKGWDHFTSTTFHDGALHFKTALKTRGIDVVHLPGHLAPADFPSSLAELKPYHAVILSDVGVNSLLLHPDTWLEGKPRPDRLRILADYVFDGGGFIMVGGYYSFQGIYGRAAYKGTLVEEILPVELLPYDDRKECPEGVIPEKGPDFSKVGDLPEHLPPLLGYNKTLLKKGSLLVFRCGSDPLLAFRLVGKGRSAAWTSDIGPHWCPPQFLEWNGYAKLWERIIRWVSGEVS